MEDYEKLYKEAIHRASGFRTQECKDVAEYIFPELKESEDERTWIINYLSNRELNSSIIAEKENLKKAIAWLEKQGEQKPADLKTKAGNWYICDTEVMDENMKTVFHRDEIYYCPKDGYLDVGGALFKVGFLDVFNVFRLAAEKDIPQPKQEWSKEDEEQLSFCCAAIELSNYSSDEHRNYAISFLESLKDRVQPKQEWSEEDDRVRIALFLFVEAYGAYANYEVTQEEMLSWLKSLRPQNTWKPSDEQLDALHDAAVYVNKSMFPHPKGILMKLYKQLKKLREE